MGETGAAHRPETIKSDARLAGYELGPEGPEQASQVFGLGLLEVHKSQVDEPSAERVGAERDGSTLQDQGLLVVREEGQLEGAWPQRERSGA